MEVDTLRKTLKQYLPTTERFRVECSDKKINRSYCYKYEKTGEIVVTCNVRCFRKVCSQFIEVPLDSQSQERQNFQAHISGGKKLQRTTKWLIALTNEETCFDNKKLASQLKKHICTDDIYKQNTRGHLDNSNACGKNINNPDGGGISDNTVEHSRASDVKERQEVTETSEVLAYTDSDYDNDYDNDNDNN
jgi:hypothetical protein